MRSLITASAMALALTTPVLAQNDTHYDAPGIVTQRWIIDHAYTAPDVHKMFFMTTTRRMRLHKSFTTGTPAKRPGLIWQGLP